MDSNILDNISRSQWQTVNNLFEIMERFFENYTNHCRNELHQTTLREELEQFRQKFHSFKCLDDVCQLFYKRMINESNLIRLNDPMLNYHFFGDLHGSLSDIILIRNMFWKRRNQLVGNHFIFLGDYVDRGIHGFEVVIYLLLLKLLYSSNFTILRGNHEFADLNSYSFLPELQIKFGDHLGRRIWIRINDSFSVLPYAALVLNNIFCCHGGIPKKFHSWAQIEMIPKSLYEVEEGTIAFQLLWNDFYSNQLITTITSQESSHVPQYFSRNKARGAGYMIGKRAVERFLKRFALSYIVRAHDFTICDPNGYDHIELKNGAVFTLFSNSSYTKAINNTAYLFVSQQEEIVKIFPLVQEQRPELFFNQSELIENDIELIEMKFKDPYSELVAELQPGEEIDESLKHMQTITKKPRVLEMGPKLHWKSLDILRRVQRRKF